MRGGVTHTFSFLCIDIFAVGADEVNCSKRAPSFGIVRTCFMVSPQKGRTKVGVLSGSGGEHSLAGLEGA